MKAKIPSDLRTTFEAKLFNQPADRQTYRATEPTGGAGCARLP